MNGEHENEGASIFKRIDYQKYEGMDISFHQYFDKEKHSYMYDF